MRAGGTGPAGELLDFTGYGKATAPKATIVKIIQTARVSRFLIFTLVILSLAEAPLGTVASAQSVHLGHASREQAISALLTQVGHLIQDNKLNEARQVLSAGSINIILMRPASLISLESWMLKKTGSKKPRGTSVRPF